MKFRTFVGRTIRLVLRPMGYGTAPLDFLEITSYPLPRAVRELDIDLVLDVGANIGQTGRELRNSGYRGRIVSFEPQAAVFEQLRAEAAGDPLWECHRLAVGEAAGELRLQVSNFSPSSSLLPMNPLHVEIWAGSEVVGTEVVVVRTLDDLAGELNLGAHRVLLKIDVQGFESQVVRGAARTLPLLRAAFVELLFAPLYAGQSRYADVIDAFAATGFQFAGLYDELLPDRIVRHVACTNALFVRPGS